MLSFTIAHVLADRCCAGASRTTDAQDPGRRRGRGRRRTGTGRRSTCAFAGVDVPLFAVIGGLGTFAAWIAVMALYTRRADRRDRSGWCWASSTYYLYRRSKGLSLTETTVVKLPTPVGAEPVEYAACWSPSRRAPTRRARWRPRSSSPPHKKGDVRVIVDRRRCRQHLDLDAPLPEAEATAQAMIEDGAPVGRPRPARQGAGREGARRARPATGSCARRSRRAPTRS